MTKKLWGSAALMVLFGVGAAEAQTGPLSFFPVPPCRLVDTRGTPGPTGGPDMGANTNRDFPILGACALPTDAAAVVFNVTITRATDFGNLRMWPQGTTLPNASIINWIAGATVANGAIVPVTVAGPNHVSVRVDMVPTSTGTVSVIIDTNGYFR